MSFILPCLPPTPSGIPKTGVRFVQDIVQRVGSKGPMGEFARALCAQLTPQLITVQHLAELLKLAQEEDNPRMRCSWMPFCACWLTQPWLAPACLPAWNPRCLDSCIQSCFLPTGLP